MRGRPKATYADVHIAEARAHPGEWRVLLNDAATVTKVVRKVRREGIEAKFLVLDDIQAFVAVRGPDEDHADR